MDHRTTVYLIDHDEPTRRQLTNLLRPTQVDLDAHDNVQSFWTSYRPETQGCILANAQLPHGDSEALINGLRKPTDLPIILLTPVADVALVVAAIRAGVLDVLQKPSSDSELRNAVNRGLEEDNKRREQLRENADLRSRLDRLTPREREVMGLVVSGKTNREIAATLSRSPKTVEVHRAQVMRKMQVDSLADLVRLSLTAEEDRMPAVTLPRKTAPPITMTIL